MKKAIISQMLILVVAWIVTTPDVAQDNTYIFGLIGDVEVVRGNGVWVALCTMVASVCNIWFWWPKASTHQVEAKAEEVRAGETKVEVVADPVVPKMD